MATAGGPAGTGAEPNNWASAFSGSAWEYDEESGEYFLHIFSRKQPDLNWENPEVRQAVYAMMRRWVDRGVDGFRMDVINLISKDPALPDGPEVAGQEVRLSGRSVANGPRLHEFLAEMNREVGLSERNLLTVGEMPGSSVELARDVTDPARGELNMVFTFEHVGLDEQPGQGKWALMDLALPVLKKNLATWQDGLAEVGWNSLYLDNHDQPRAVSRFGDDSAEHRVASAKTLGDGAAPAQGHALRLPGRRARHDEQLLHGDRALPGPRGGQLVPRDPQRGGEPAEPACGRWRPRAATTPAPRCSGTTPRTPASRPARPGCP